MMRLKIIAACRVHSPCHVRCQGVQPQLQASGAEDRMEQGAASGHRMHETGRLAVLDGHDEQGEDLGQQVVAE